MKNKHIDPRLAYLLEKHPRLELILKAGVISKKTARTILDLDRELMEGLYVRLIEIGAITGMSNNAFKGREEML